MANILKHKQSSVAGKVPATTDLSLGELAINTRDGKLYLKKNVSGVETIVDVTAGGLLPASSSTLGGVKGLANLTIDGVGNLSLSGANVGSALGYTPVNRAGDTTMTGVHAITADGATQDTANYGVHGVTRSPGTSAKSYYALTRQGERVWALGIDTSNQFVIGAPQNDGSQNLTAHQDLLITPGGHLRVPYQPAVYMSGGEAGIPTNADWIIGRNGQLTTTNITNRGGHFNQATGIFTCPAAGAYMVVTNFTCYGGTYNVVSRISKNGVGVGFPQLNYSGTLIGNNNCAIINCAANDTIAGTLNPTNGTSASFYSYSICIYFLG